MCELCRRSFIRGTTALGALGAMISPAAMAQAQPGGQAGAQGGPGAGPEPGANGAGAKKDEGVIDAEYVDVEDKK